ncbi:MAG: sigma-70 family RNA polymerase sigma factor [Flavobacteriaceae bacterium]|nr:sigma-70 family RNA polymerase sigma factor [Flavobacteriaceae bacterium]
MQTIKSKPYQSFEQNQVIDAIKINDTDTLKHLYTTNYYKIEILILKNNGTKEHAKDIYQDAFLVFWRNVKQDKFVPQNENSISGYLYTIAKHKWMDYLRSKNYKKTVVSSAILDIEVSETDFDKINDDKINDERLHSVMHAFKVLGMPCKSLLTKFYFEKKSMKDIAKELQLDAASTRNKKYRCMQKLRELALNLK